MAIKAAWDKGIDVISTARTIAEEEGFVSLGLILKYSAEMAG